MKILHLLASGGAGGIETLCKDISATEIVENHFIFVWYGGCTADEMISNGTNTVVLAHSKKTIIKTYKTICDYIEKHHIDSVIVHHEAPVLWMFLCMFKKKFKNIKTVIYIHAHLNDVLKPEKKKTHAIRKKILEYSARKADFVIAISDIVKKSLTDAGFSDKNIRKVYNGTDLKKFSSFPKKERGEKTEFIFVGRLIKEKGVQNVLDALYLLDKKSVRSKLHFSIVGDGIYADELKSKSEQLQLDDCVTFCGKQRDIPERLAASTFFIHLPEWEEGFGITLIEAMAAGLPSIVYNRGAMCELVQNNKNGFLLEPDIHKAAETIKHIVSDMSSEEYLKMSENALEYSKNFSIENCVAQIKNILS